MIIIFGRGDQACQAAEFCLERILGVQLGYSGKSEYTIRRTICSLGQYFWSW